MRAVLFTSLSLTLLLAGCECESHEADAGPDVDAGQDCSLCPTCDDSIQLRIDAPGVSSSEVMVSGAMLTCEPAGGFVYCGARSVPPGMYEVTITAPGFMDQQLFFEIDGPLDPDDCCSCPGTFSMLVTLQPE